MKKLTSALAVAALVAAPAMASAQGPQVYGQIHTSLEMQDGGEQDGLNVMARASRVGVRGGAPLDVGNMMVIYQVESELDTAKGGGTLAQRDTYVGLRGNFGMVRIGRMVPPSTVLRARTDLFSDQIGDARNGLPNTAFDLRVQNSIAYAIQFGDVGVDLFYSTEEGLDASVEDAKSMFGVGVSYASGPLYVGATYEDHNDDFEYYNAATGSTSALSDMWSARLGASYTMGDLRFAGMFQHADFGALDDTTMSIGGGVAYSIDRLTLKAQAYMSTWDEMDDMDTTLVALGVDYALSDATTGYVAFATNLNDDFVNGPNPLATGVPYAAGTVGSTVGAEMGEDTTAFGVGLIHRF